jgi:RHS repeat-associated protein
LCNAPKVSPSTTNYIYDNQNIVLEDTQTGTISARYIHGPNIDEPLAMEINAGANYIPYYYHSDGLGSITAMSDSQGSIVQRYAYDSFGTMTITQQGNISQPFTFTGREYDPETEMYIYRARYYDPQVGRFVTKDPIGFDGGDVNLYNYVSGNPVNWIDPWGLRKCSGTARVIRGNSKLIGKLGAFNGFPSNPDLYGVTSDSAAIIPSQFGKTKSELRPYIECISGVIEGNVTFNRVRDIMDDAKTRARLGYGNNVNKFQDWLIEREAKTNYGKAPFIIELPGINSDMGFKNIELTIPDGFACPSGTTEVKECK